MKLQLSLLSTLLLASASTFAVEPPVTVNGGNINFEGELVNAACAVDVNSANQKVELGQYRTATLAKAGDKTTPVSFKINLVDCDPEVQATAAVAFNGQTKDVSGNLLTTNSGGNGVAATNVGIEISDSISGPLVLNGANFSTPKNLMPGNNTMYFSARYVATGVATPGAANSAATFVVRYE